MAIHVYHGGDNSDGTTWAKAYQSIENAAVVGAAAGAEIWVASDHSETKNGAHFSMAFSNGTVASPVRIISVKRADDSYETMHAAGGEIETLGAADDITISGGFILVGIKLVAKDFIFINATYGEMIDCYLSSGDNTQVSLTEGVFRFDSSTLIFSDSFTFSSRAGCTFKNCVFTNPPAAGMFTLNSLSRQILFEDCDLSGEADIILDPSSFPASIILRRCSLATSYVALADVFDHPDATLLIESCIAGTSTDSIIGMQRYETFYGSVLAETTTYRSGGASDGTTGYSWKMTSNARTREYLAPLQSPPVTRWVAAGSQTLTVHLNHEAVGDGGSGDLQDDEFWIAVSSPNEATPATSRGVRRTSRPATILTTPSDLTNNSETWESAKSVKQQVSVTIDPEEAGPVTIRFCLGKPSVIVYVDPKIEVS